MSKVVLPDDVKKVGEPVEVALTVSVPFDAPFNETYLLT
jgi:hypothetical protein